MIEEGMLLYFIPPCFASGIKNVELKKRLMLVLEHNKLNNKLTLVNISKVKGKPNCFTYPFNILIKKYNPPLPILSFAKLNDNYIIDYFKGLEKYIYKDGIKLNYDEYKNIKERHKKYIKNNKIELVTISERQFLKINNYYE